MIRVDYAGPGGACEGLRSLGLEPVGIEWDAAACATRAAAGHLTIRADLATYRPYHRPGSVAGYWASPPCQTFSTAGKGDGRDQLDDLAAVIHAERWADADLFDDKTRHVIDAARTAVELTPEWVAMEQVPAVLPLWRALCHVLERHGYSTWCGVLCAADFAVPQTRRRAILMASRVSAVSPPVPTHAERPGMFGERPWVSMADALGWDGLLERPGLTFCGSNEGGGDLAGGSGARQAIRDAREGGQWKLSPGIAGYEQPNRRKYGLNEPAPTLAFGHDAASWCWERPATTVCADPRLGDPGHRDREGGEPRSWEVRTKNATSTGGTYKRGAGEAAPTVTSRTHLWRVLPSWPFHQPATTVAGDPRITARCHHEAGSQGANAVDVADVAAGVDPGDRPIRLTVRDALILQGFPPDYPVQGSRSKQFEQVGNAVPPPLAAHIIAALTGAHYERNVT